MYATDLSKAVVLFCFCFLFFCLLLWLVVFLIWATSWQNQQNECAPSEDSDQPWHSPSLIRVFAVRIKKDWVLSYPMSAQRRLWSDWADAQSDLSLRWAHSHFVGFDMSRLICEALHYSLFSRVFLQSCLGLKIPVFPLTRPTLYFLCRLCNFYCLPEKKKNKKIFIPIDPKMFHKIRQ